MVMWRRSPSFRMTIDSNWPGEPARARRNSETARGSSVSGSRGPKNFPISSFREYPEITSPAPFTLVKRPSESKVMIASLASSNRWR